MYYLTVSKRILLDKTISQRDVYTRYALWIDKLDTFQYDAHMSSYMDCIINVKRL